MTTNDNVGGDKAYRAYKAYKANKANKANKGARCDDDGVDGS